MRIFGCKSSFSVVQSVIMIQTTTNLKCLQRLQNFKEMIGALNSFIASSNLLLNVPKRLFVVAFYYGSNS